MKFIEVKSHNSGETLLVSASCVMGISRKKIEDSLIEDQNYRITIITSLDEYTEYFVTEEEYNARYENLIEALADSVLYR